MSHVKWAAAVLVILIVISVWGEYRVRRDCAELTDLLAALQTAARENDTEAKTELCGAVTEKWESSKSIFMLTVPLEKICQAEQSICRLEPLLNAESEELEAEAAAASSCCDVICR